MSEFLLLAFLLEQTHLTPFCHGVGLCGAVRTTTGCPSTDTPRALATRLHPPNSCSLAPTSPQLRRTKNLHLSLNQILPLCSNMSIKREILSKYQKLKQGRRNDLTCAFARRISKPFRSFEMGLESGKPRILSITTRSLKKRHTIWVTQWLTVKSPDRKF